MYVGCAVCKTCFQRVYTQYFRRFSFEMRRLVGAYECAREHTNAAETASAHSASTHTHTSILHRIRIRYARFYVHVPVFTVHVCST